MTPYLLSDDLRDAVRVAVAIRRPLLVLGDPGTGKSSIARFVAESWGWSYAEEVVTSRTGARDLLWRFDAVRRLADAQGRQVGDPGDYVEPRALWWAFAPVSAQAQRTRAGRGEPPRKLGAPAPGSSPLPAVAEGEGVVVLIDEIDKADPDVPNDLLGPLAERRFVVDESGERVGGEAGRELVLITSNRERDLPLAFVRRCVVVTLERPGVDGLVAIAGLHGHAEAEVQAYAKKFVAERDSFTERKLSTAEFLDALAARRLLGDAGWPRIMELVVKKVGATG